MENILKHGHISVKQKYLCMESCIVEKFKILESFKGNDTLQIWLAHFLTSVGKQNFTTLLINKIFQ